MLSARYVAAAIAFGLVWGLAVGSHAQEWETVRIEADEYRFVPNRIKPAAGQPVRIEIHNSGNEQHEFRSRLLESHFVEIEGGGVTIQGTGIHSILIEKGTIATIQWLSPTRGTYEFECRIPSHHGMDGTIIVEEEKSPGP